MGLVDLLEALGRLVHVVAIPVGVVEERQLLERFFYRCLVGCVGESQHFEVLGAGGRHRSGCPWWCQLFRAAQGVQRRANESRLESAASVSKQRSANSAKKQLGDAPPGFRIHTYYGYKRRAAWNSLEPSRGPGAMALLRVAARPARRYAFRF